MKNRVLVFAFALAMSIVVGFAASASADSPGLIAAIVAQLLGGAPPSTSGTNGQALTTNGSGTLSWSSPATAFPLLAPNGTSSAPSYSSSAATNAGLFFSGNGVPALASGGTLLATFDATNSNPTITLSNAALSETSADLRTDGGIAFMVNHTSNDIFSNVTYYTAQILGSFGDGGTASQASATGLLVQPTINFTGATRTGHYEGLTVNAVETSLPSGTNYLMRLQAGATGGTDKLLVDNSGNVSAAGKITKYNNVTTTGLGVPAIYNSGTFAAASTLQSAIAAFTPGATGTFQIRAWLNVVTAGSASLNVQVTYQDENNAAQTATVALSPNSGTATVAAVSATGPYYGTITIRANATAITVKTVGTAATSYDGGATIAQIQ